MRRSTLLKSSKPICAASGSTWGFAVTALAVGAAAGRVDPADLVRRIADGPLAGVAARAVVVLDENDKVLHNELVAEIGSEPNYEAALAVLK